MIKLKSVYQEYIWGGSKIHELLHKDTGTLPRVAESWEVSTHPAGKSIVENGAFRGKTLNEYFDQIGWGTAGRYAARNHQLPILIKYIDAKSNLSVQVHPDDAYARRVEGDNGKTEMWYIVQADEGAGIYCGFREDTDKALFRQKVSDGTVEELLNFIPVKAGDCYLIEAGTVHAIGAGCVICEVQQSSNVTYRVYDYNRRGADGKLRPLHVEKAAATASLQKYVVPDARRKSFLGGCKYFSAYRYRRGKRFLLHSFASVTVTKGAFAVGDVPLKRGETAFVSAEQPFCVKGSGEYVLVCVE